MERSYKRLSNQLRPVIIVPNVLPQAEGSVQIEFGHTKVICTASVEEKVPPFLKGKGTGWVTAEYGMLPRSTNERMRREREKLGGRTMEIQRLIGRSLRTAVDLAQLGERQITIDCDVISADGGTRTASITGGYVALGLAIRWLVAQGKLPKAIPLLPVSAISVGLVGQTPCLDLDYAEDSAANVDMNFVMNGEGRFIEVQGTAERGAFSWEQMEALKDLAVKGCRELMASQQQALERGV